MKYVQDHLPIRCFQAQRESKQEHLKVLPSQTQFSRIKESSVVTKNNEV